MVLPKRRSSSSSHRRNSWRNCSVKVMTQVSFTSVDEVARFTPDVPRMKETFSFNSQSDRLFWENVNVSA